METGEVGIALRLALLAGLALLAACGGAQGAGFTEAELATAMAEVAAEFTETAEAEPTSTPAPTETAPAAGSARTTPELSPTGPHGDGMYVVGVEIAPGLWRSIRTPDMDTERFCYFSRRKYDGVLLGSYYGLPGPNLLIRPGDYEVEMDGCGMWVYMGER